MTGMFSPVSPQADAISELFLTVLVICGVIFVIVASVVTYAIVRSLRERARGKQPPDATENENSTLEAIWTAIPVAIVVGIFVLSVRAADEADPAEQGPPDVIVRGHQWWWEVEYPGKGVITANEVHLPVGKTVHVQVESADVVHDFWLPELSRKIDAIPGRENRILFTPRQTGRYEGICAEFCGDQHAWMRFEAVVHEPADYDAWLEAQARPADPPVSDDARAGLAVYRRETCDRCHTLRGATPGAAPIQIGPDLTHLASRRMFGAGVLANDEANLVAWLKDPQAIKEGCHMPNFQLSDEDAAVLAAYLSGLQ